METNFHRHRRLRKTPGLRAMVRETFLRKEDLIYPIFVVEGEKVKNEVPSMPGVYQLSLDLLNVEMNQVEDLDIPAVIVFGVPGEKDDCGSEAYAENGIVQQAVRQIKDNNPSLTVIADTCLCQFTDHGHCGVIENGEVLNDPSLDLLTKTQSHRQKPARILLPLQI